MAVSSRERCNYMASIAHDYCALIENLEDEGVSKHWLSRMSKLLPELHSTIVTLDSPASVSGDFVHKDDDETRCELFMRLNEFLLSDQAIWPDYDKYDLKLNMCESLAYDFTGMYFDLKKGLELLSQYPNYPSAAISNWRTSFYYHWGRKLMDAEGWFYAVGIRESNAQCFMFSDFRSA